MATYIIKGGQKLKGSVKIGGNKNSVLPCLAACLLTEEPVTLENIPEISDVKIFIQLLQEIGASVVQKDDTLVIQAEDITHTHLPKDLMKKLRASILIVGPMLARLGEIEFYHPGGDIIGKRSLDTHFSSLEKLGFNFDINNQHYKAFRHEQAPYSLEIFLEEASVTGAENLIMTATLGDGEVVIKNCPEEPHVVDLCDLLNSMGANIKGIGTSQIRVTGVKKLHGTTFRIGQDFIELGTYAVAAAITGGEIILSNCSPDGMEPVTIPLKKMGLDFIAENGDLRVRTKELVAIPKLITNIWPGFPSDFMSPLILLATQAQGVSLLHDWMYESRMFFVDKLISMGAHITIADPHRVLVYGPTSLVGRELESPDIRAGMAILLAALVAKGETTIHHAELIERGYANVVENLQRLGAQIVRED